MAHVLNERTDPAPVLLKHRDHVLVAFPDDRFEAVVFQWEGLHPTVIIQLKLDIGEPIQFPGQRPAQAGNDTLPKDRYPLLDQPVVGLVNPIRAATFMQPLYRADIVFSMTAFQTVQPSPGQVIPLDNLAELRREALNALNIVDEPGFIFVS